ncbi:integrase core domain-containing protein [Methylobacterium sp. 4-46]|uniref:integrase core domain-containing protein n=1 Tax=Methylobacterium sp. CB376 TaxID=3138063 RepID=UPI000A0205D1
MAASLNGRPRDECLNANRFSSLADARAQIGAWRRPGRPPNETRRPTLRPDQDPGDRHPALRGRSTGSGHPGSRPAASIRGPPPRGRPHPERSAFSRGLDPERPIATLDGNVRLRRASRIGVVHGWRETACSYLPH